MVSGLAVEPSILAGPPLEEEEGIGALTLGTYVRDLAKAFASREAAVAHRGEGRIRWSYGDLLAESMKVARALVACGLGKGSRVAILQTNTPEFLASVFGTALIGGVATPISTFFTASELSAVLKMSCCRVLLMDAQVVKKDYSQILVELEPALADVPLGTLSSFEFPFLRHVATIGGSGTGGIEAWDDFLKRGESVPAALVEAMADAVAPSDPAVLFFSSGSTGKPKGILSAHRGVCLQLWRWPRWYRIAEPPRTWVANGFFWSGNFAMALGGTLSSGGTLILQGWFDPAEAIDLVERERATMLIAWPHQWAQLVAMPNYADADLSSLIYVDQTSPIAQHRTVRTSWRQPSDSYGSTETFTLISAHDPSSAHKGDMSHGVPTAGSVIKIVDVQTGDILPRGHRGEIAVKGPTLMLGYLGIPADETLDDGGFLRTGDGGYVDENGHLVWEGRLNDIIKTGGANVSPIEVDDVLRTHPAIKIVQTVGVPDELLGELVVSCVVRLGDQCLSEADVTDFAKQRLASFKVPRRVLFFEENQFETTGSAKIKLEALRTLAAARLAEAISPERSSKEHIA